ncbi:PP2C family protein-serine/threonine phosphatase [Kitasatospora sp. HPMI-4]|uniref:PP2C family protein-serine/threonine phosphatase n=1 Tax=Kitasatospora sp. HPMI-4 TaxID=3448443 RepID=UPI003F1DAC2F
MTGPTRLTPKGRKRITPSDYVNLMPFVLMALTVVLDLATPVDLQFDRLLSAVPALAACTYSVSGTLWIGLLTLVVNVSLAAGQGLLLRPGHFFTVGAIAAVTLAAALASGFRQRRERTLADVRSVAETAQRVLLRPVPHHLGHVTVDTLYMAAAAEARIGGDLYEAMRTPHGVRLLIGDVRGKGLLAVEAAAIMLGAFREAAHDEPDLPHLAHRVETSMIRTAAQLPGGDVAERFVTAVFVEIPDDEPAVRIVNCGHPPPLLIHDGHVREVEATAPSPPLNLGMLVQDGGYHVDVVPFTAGDQLLLYTDGVTETRDLGGTFYPLVERVRSWLAAPPGQLLDLLHQDLVTYSNGTLHDDIAALAARRLPTTAGPSAG